MHGKTYTIPARDVVPGMQLDGGYVAVVQHDHRPSHPNPRKRHVFVIDTPTATHLANRSLRLWDGERVTVQLPGPSPREIFPDDADRLRVWPAPLNGEPWQWDDGDPSVDMGPCWWTEEGYCVTPDSLCSHAIDDAELACFYLPDERKT